MICLIYNSCYKPAVSRTFAFHGHGLGPTRRRSVRHCHRTWRI